MIGCKRCNCIAALQGIQKRNRATVEKKEVNTVVSHMAKMK